MLAFAMTPEEHRQVLQAFFKAESWKVLINSAAYPLQSLAADSVAFASKMKTLGKKLKKEHAEFYALRVGGDSLMPSDYRSQEHSIEEGTQLVQDLDELSSVAAPTTRERLIDARLGQGRFRREVLARRGGSCAVTGCTLGAVLRASHVRPWAREVDVTRQLAGVAEPRVDPDNGLPLVATLDALFDSGLMTFNDDGDAIFADGRVEKSLIAGRLIPADMHLNRPSGDALKLYLRIHRDEVFKGSNFLGRAGISPAGQGG